jgi:hypothetical protein
LKNNNGFETKSQIRIIVKYMSIIKKIMFKVCQIKKMILSLELFVEYVPPKVKILMRLCQLFKCVLVSIRDLEDVHIPTNIDHGR